MKKNLVGMLILVACIGTAVAETTSVPAAQAEQSTPVAPEPKHAEVTFLDSKLFDGQLAKELRANNDTVEVNISGKMSLNTIPPRIDKWITSVGESGELKVKMAEPELQPKFILALLPLVYSYLKETSEDRMLEQAKKYNATIIYHNDSSGDTRIEKIVFIRKK